MEAREKTAQVDTAPTSSVERTAIDLLAELLRRGRPVELRVGGRSMWPLVRTGDRLRIEPGLVPRIGDLAAVLRHGHLVVHRVLSLTGDRVRLRGDNRGEADPDVGRGEILGVVTLQKLRGGYELDHRLRWIRLLDRGALVLSQWTRAPWRLAKRLAVWRRHVRES